MNKGRSHTPTLGAGNASTRAIQRRAAEWLALRHARSLTLTEGADFADWHARDPRHAALYSEVEASWRAFDTLADYPHSADLAPDPDLLARPRCISRFIAPSLLAAAAAITILATVQLNLRWFGGPGTEAVAIAHMEPGLARLPDGSGVEVHAGGEVTEHYTPGERRVQLVRGEAYFTVAKDPARPFIVEALEANFNVVAERRTNGEIVLKRR
jgi:transmembrane sensor